ncbi:MAG: nucleotidyltransferase domain-containing protein, partial [Bacteroidetes bacterium]
RTTLARLYGNRLVGLVLFGSQARGEANEDSDVDVLVVLRGPVDIFREIKRMGLIQTQLLVRHDVFLSLHPCAEDNLEAVRRGKAEHPFLKAIQAEGVVL